MARFLARIRTNGLRPRGRNHVHLSTGVEESALVGARRGDPVVLAVDAAGMHRAGFAFYRTTNGVWLTAHVPPEWITPDVVEDPLLIRR